MLEVGVGTGLSLPAYDRHLEIVGIDLSPEMLEKARERVAAEGLDNVTGLHEMDASDLKFPDASFDTVVAMYVMTVVPDPEKVMRELSRVCRAGRRGDHRQPLQRRKRACAAGSSAAWRRSPTSWAGARCSTSSACWCARTSASMEKRGLRPLGLFTMMRFRKRDVPMAVAAE